MRVSRRNLRGSTAAILAMVMSAGVASATPTPGGATVTATPARVAVTGVATIRGKAQSAPIRWSYSKEGKAVESAVAPRMTVTRLSSNVPLMMIKLPTELFAIRIGADLHRVLDEPILLDSKAESTCSCRMRPDCGSAEAVELRCRVEGWLVEGIGNREPGTGNGGEP